MNELHDAQAFSGALDARDRHIANVSVVIATVGRPDDFACCLKALRSGTTLPAEVVVVDQSTDDRTRSMIQAYQGELPRVVYLRQQRRGMSAAQNLAVSHASCALIGVTDDDCAPADDWVERVEQQLSFADGDDFVTGRVWPMEPKGDLQYPVASRTSDHRRRFYGKVVPWDVGSGNNFAVKRDWFVRIRGCDERLGPGAIAKGGADMDLFYRLLRRGAVGSYEPDLVVHHARQTKKGRLDRRVPYGYGMGVCCVVYARERDWYSLAILGHWVTLRGRMLASALLRGRWMRAYEEILMLYGTIRGLVFGLRHRISSWERTVTS